MIKGRLIIAIVSTLAEEAILVAVVLWGLPRFGIEWPPWVLIALMVVLAANAVFFYRVGSRALMRKPVSGLGSVVGHKGKAVSELAPEGVVRIGDELWDAAVEGGWAEVGEEVSVVEQDGLKLTVVVRKSQPGGS